MGEKEARIAFLREEKEKKEFQENFYGGPSRNDIPIKYNSFGGEKKKGKKEECGRRR